MLFDGIIHSAEKRSPREPKARPGAEYIDKVVACLWTTAFLSLLYLDIVCCHLDTWPMGPDSIVTDLRQVYPS